MTDIAAEAPEAAPPRAQGWTDTAPHPWRRLFGRMLDISLLGYLPVALVYAGLAMAGFYDAAEQIAGVLSHPLMRFIGSAVSVAIALPLSALLLALTGGSPGKWLAGVRVRRPDGAHPSLAQAFRREASVAFSGLALGFPLISLYTLHQAYERLEKRGAADWDAGRFVVTYRPAGMLQTVLTIACALASLAFIAPGVMAELVRVSG